MSSAPTPYWTNFRAFAPRTAALGALDLPPNHYLAYLGCGLAGEALEVADALATLCRVKDAGKADHVVHEAAVALREELGDLAWYLAMIENVAAFPIPWPVTTTAVLPYSDPEGMLLRGAALVAEALKRPILGRALHLDRLHEGLGILASVLLRLARYSVDDPEDPNDIPEDPALEAILRGNENKLLARYGEKLWTVQAADKHYEDPTRQRIAAAVTADRLAAAEVILGQILRVEGSPCTDAANDAFKAAAEIVKNRLFPY